MSQMNKSNKLHSKTSVFICPNCNQRVYRQPFSGDLVHECSSGNDTLDYEDIVIIGNYNDYSGSRDDGPAILATLGIQNHSEGTRVGVEGGMIYDRTVRGNRSSTHRQRKKLIHTDFKND